MSVEKETEDDVIDVRMPRKDYEIMRDMIARQKALNWIGKWVKQVVFVTAGGIITILALWDWISKFLNITTPPT